MVLMHSKPTNELFYYKKSYVLTIFKNFDYFANTSLDFNKCPGT